MVEKESIIERNSAIAEAFHAPPGTARAKNALVQNGLWGLPPASAIGRQR